MLFNPNTLKVGGGSEIQDHPCQLNDSEDILGYVRPCLLFSMHAKGWAQRGKPLAQRRRSKDNTWGLLASVSGQIGNLQVQV